MAGQDARTALAPFLAELRAAFPPVESVRPLDVDAEGLAAAFSDRVVPASLPAPQG